MLVKRLIFGTARLTGGADAPASRRVVEAALAAGIGHIDTAPLYGMGTAEALVGEVLKDRPEIKVTTKAGMEAPAYGILRSHARRVLRLLRPERPTLDQDYPPAPPIKRNHAGAFGSDALRRSVDRSMAKLHRSRIDLLLLHDAYAGDLDAATIEFLDAERTHGCADHVGYAIAATLVPAIHALAPPSWTAQVGFNPQWIGGTGELLPRSLIVHSIAKTWFHLSRADPQLAAAMTRASALVGAAGGSDERSREIVMLYALAAIWLPEAAFVFATTDRERLRQFMTGLREIGEASSPDELAAAFGGLEQRTVRPGG